KRQMGLEIARETNSSHYASFDTDELYYTNEVKEAIRLIERNGWDGTACKIATYHRNPLHRMRGLAGFYVPFIHETKKTINYSSHTRYFVYADPTRGTTGLKNPYTFDEGEVVM